MIQINVTARERRVLPDFSSSPREPLRDVCRVNDVIVYEIEVFDAFRCNNSRSQIANLKHQVDIRDATNTVRAKVAMRWGVVTSASWGESTCGSNQVHNP